MRKTRTLWLCFLLLFLRPPGAAGQDTKGVTIRRAPANLTFTVQNPHLPNLRFEVEERGTARTAAIALDQRSCSVVVTPGPAGQPEKDAYPLRVAPGASAARQEGVSELTVKFRPCFWALYCGPTLMVRFPAPFEQPAAFRLDPRHPPQGEDARPFVQAVGAFVFDADFMVPEGEASALSVWEQESGTWSIHRAYQGTRKEVAPEACSEHSPNFYSVSGSGRPGVMTAGYDFYDAYLLRAAVRLVPGESGLVFWHRDGGRYYTFTLTVDPRDNAPVVARLRRVSGPSPEDREELEAVRVNLAGPQWMLLQVCLSPGRIMCFVDQTRVLDLGEEGPPGGKFGLYADSPQPVLFDDVAVRSNRDLDLRSRQALRFHTLSEKGDFFGREAELLAPAVSPQPQTLVLGARTHAPHVFSAVFSAPPEGKRVGVLTRTGREDGLYFRFAMERSARGREAFSLEQVRGARTNVMAACEVDSDSIGPVCLMADATMPSQLRLYRNDRLVLVHYPDTDLDGGSGLYVGPGADVRITDVIYDFERKGLNRSRFEKNRVFAEDPYMRHWSSPEGEWVEDEKGRVWHKSDFFGRFRLRVPVVEGAEVHLGVPEDTDVGQCTVAVRDGELHVTEGPETTRARPQADAVEIHYEDHRLWITEAGRVLLMRFLPEPMKGTRIRVAGFATEALHKSFAIRYCVNDCLFKEAPFAWIQNGGDWQIVNRFTCRPRWSHMNGESEHGLAAIWTRYRYRGDFCIELYAGMRQGWYDRCGDWNLTAMAADTTPGRGYTVTCTGWDVQHSQRYTTLYRDGVAVAQSDAYLAPRHREGNERRWLNPLVPEGRPFHGAWFYMKLRRIGNRVEYYFDNKKVFSFDDEQPLREGLAGVWTYMNSMMVARVKVAAREMTPLPVEFEPLASTPSAMTDTLSNSRWRLRDPVGHAVLTWSRDADDKPYFKVDNRLGSGEMHAQCTLPARLLSEVAGWRFLVKRTSKACVNFHFTVGEIYSSEESAPTQRYFHRLSGTDFSKGPCSMAGQTAVDPVPAGENWSDRGEWTPVTVWLPAEAMDVGRGGVVRVRVDGFGNLQPGYVVQGLKGNGPGQGYAVKGFTEIPYREPADPPAVECAWSDTVADAFVLRCAGEGRDRRFARAQVFVDGRLVKGVAPNFHERLVRVPRQAGREEADALAVRVRLGTNDTPFLLPWKDRPLGRGPILEALGGVTPFFETFETAVSGRKVRGGKSRKSLLYDKTDGSRYLAIQNTELKQRLRHDFGFAESVSRFPVLQFRYRAGDMACVSAGFDRRRLAALSENNPRARAVRWQRDFLMNRTWSAWQGNLTDIVGSVPFDPHIYTFDKVSIGSFATVDQTGKYSSLDLDDVVLGPVVASAQDLQCTPEYCDVDGVQSVELAVHGSIEGYTELSSSQLDALTWQTFAPGERAVPDLSGIGDGLCHLFLWARDGAGHVSRVTDIPFVLDRTPMRVQASIVDTKHPLSNGSFLKVTMETDGGASPVVSRMRITWDGEPCTVEGLLNTFEHTPDRDTLTVNWPYVWRDALNTAEEGAAFEVGVENLQDGAGRRVPDLAVPIKVDRSADVTGPALLPTAYPTNVFLMTSWEGAAEDETYWKTYYGNRLEVIREWGQAPYLLTETYRGLGKIHLSTRKKGRGTWELDKYPYFAFRIRRPVIDPNGPPIVMHFYYAAEDKYSVALTPNAEDPELLSLKEPIPWRAGVWHSVVIKLKDLLPPEEAKDRIRILSVYLMQEGAKDPSAVHLADMCILGEWRSPEQNPVESTVTLDGYDISGLAGVEWEYLDRRGHVIKSGRSDGLSLAPAALDLPVAAAPWLALRLRDRAGNASAPVRMPYVNGL